MERGFTETHKRPERRAHFCKFQSISISIIDYKTVEIVEAKAVVLELDGSERSSFFGMD